MESRSEDEIQEVLNRYREAIDYEDTEFLEKFVKGIDSLDFKLIARVVALDIQLRRGPVTDSSPDNIRDFGDEFSVLVERVLRSQAINAANPSGELTEGIQLDATSVDVSLVHPSETTGGERRPTNLHQRNPEMVIDHH